MRQPELTGDFSTLMGWADAVRTLKVRTNADTPKDAATARKFGAQGIGLCRTEHMFFESDRFIAVRQMILADTNRNAKRHWPSCFPCSAAISRRSSRPWKGCRSPSACLIPPCMNSCRTRPKRSRKSQRPPALSAEKLNARAAALHESNPMLGHRGCRLGITYPEIYEMQARAILEAAANVVDQGGQPVQLEIMVPLVGFKSELDRLSARIAAGGGGHQKVPRVGDGLMIGTMIELPRAALRAAEIAKTAEFFSFGTNDLTQTTLGLSRDDAGMFLNEYINKGVIARDPFVSIDVDGVGELIRIATHPWTRDPQQSQARHLRRAWRRPGLHPLLPRHRSGLRFLLAFPRSGGATCGRTSRTRATW